MFDFFAWLALILGGYLLGGVLFSRLIPLWVKGVDVCALSDDGNPGTFNAFRHCGKTVGFTCLLADMAKGFLPVFLALHVLDFHPLPFALVMVAPVLGHAFSPFWHFRGGKCIAAIFGEGLALLPISPMVLILAGWYILFSTLVRIRSHRTRSLATFLLFTLTAVPYECLHGRLTLALGSAALAAIALTKHLLSHEEAPVKKEEPAEQESLSITPRDSH